MVRVTMSRFPIRPKCRCCVRPCQHDRAKKEAQELLTTRKPRIKDAIDLSRPLFRETSDVSEVGGA